MRENKLALSPAEDLTQNFLVIRTSEFLIYLFIYFLQVILEEGFWHLKLKAV